MHSSNIRIGYGEDSHRLVGGRPLIIGGVAIENSPLGSDAHSDGDVLLHALADALLSAFALGDIGQIFPPQDPAHEGKPGKDIIREVLGRLRQVGERITYHNVSAVVTLDAPKLGGSRRAIESRVASLLGLEPGRVGVTFKTSEGAFPGHIQARVTVLLSSEPY